MCNCFSKSVCVVLGWEEISFANMVDQGIFLVSCRKGNDYQFICRCCLLQNLFLFIVVWLVAISVNTNCKPILTVYILTWCKGHTMPFEFHSHHNVSVNYFKFFLGYKAWFWSLDNTSSLFRRFRLPSRKFRTIRVICLYFT